MSLSRRLPSLNKYLNGESERVSELPVREKGRNWGRKREKLGEKEKERNWKREGEGQSFGFHGLFVPDS